MVEVHDRQADLFMGASGANPARLHLGFHYPRSKLTREACQRNYLRFMTEYGDFTHGVHTNIYGIAAEGSLIDFGTYRQLLAGETEFITVPRPAELGLRNLEGAILTGERHVRISDLREHFRLVLGSRFCPGSNPMNLDDSAWDWTIDCTFSANDAESVERFEPCVTCFVEGPTGMAVTIMDGSLPSLYPYNEETGVNTLTSATHTPLSKTITTYAAARERLSAVDEEQVAKIQDAMMTQMAHFWPAVRDLYKHVGAKTAIRAMPKSAADARLVDVVKRGDRLLRVRAGKIDAIFSAADQVMGIIRK